MDNGPTIHEIDASWVSTAHTTRGISDDRVSVAAYVADPDGSSLDWQRVDGYDGAYRFSVATDAPKVTVCATVEYVDHPEPGEEQHWALGDKVCTEVTLDRTAGSVNLTLTVWN